MTDFQPPVVPRYVLVELSTPQWGAVNPATYVASRTTLGFMGTIRTVEVGDVWAGMFDD